MRVMTGFAEVHAARCTTAVTPKTIINMRIMIYHEIWDTNKYRIDNQVIRYIHIYKYIQVYIAPLSTRNLITVYGIKR